VHTDIYELFTTANDEPAGAATGGQRMPGDARKLAVRDLLFPREAKPQEDDGGDEEKRKLAVRDTLLPREETKCDLGDDDEC
jgi:hypothetical protein